MKLNRYSILTLYVGVSILGFLCARPIASKIFDHYNKDADLVSQILDKIIFTFKFIGFYILIMVSTSFIGLLQNSKEKELYKGFLYSMVFCVLLIILFLIALLYFHSD